MARPLRSAGLRAAAPTRPRVAVLHRGRARQVPEPGVLRREPERGFVTGLIGDNDIFRGRITSVSRGVREVENPGGIGEAFLVGACRPSQDAVPAIRPERVGLPEPGLFSNEFEARVDSILFTGDHLRLRLNLCGVSDFIVKIPNIVGHGGLLARDGVSVGWAVTDCRALPRDSLEGSPETERGA